MHLFKSAAHFFRDILLSCLYLPMPQTFGSRTFIPARSRKDIIGVLGSKSEMFYAGKARKLKKCAFALGRPHPVTFTIQQEQ